MLIERIDALLGIVNPPTDNEQHASLNSLVDFTKFTQNEQHEHQISSNKTLRKLQEILLNEKQTDFFFQLSTISAHADENIEKNTHEKLEKMVLEKTLDCTSLHNNESDTTSCSRASSSETVSVPIAITVNKLIRKKWHVENFKSPDHIVETVPTSSAQTVYIYSCENAKFRVPAKCNAITLDNCRSVELEFESVVSSVSVVNSKKCTIFVTVGTPMIEIDCSDTIDVFLANDEVKLITNKASCVNINVKDVEGDFREVYVPEQFETVYDREKKKWVTTPTESI